MSTRYLKTIRITAAAALAIALGNASPLWAAEPQAVQLDNRDGAVTPLRSTQAIFSPPVLLLAMMDDMGEMDDMDDMDEMAKMKKMKKKGGMSGKGQGKMKDNMPSDDSMPDTDSSGSMQDPKTGPSGADMMGRMRGSKQGRPGMSRMAAASRLPGFPGASHLYHIGATGFFLDHPEHITLSIEQQTALNRIKEKALLDRANSDRRIENAEQELWTLTAAESPDAVKIEAQVRASERLRGEQRLAFIRAVGEAGKVLTPDQRAALLGTKPPAGGQSTDTGKPQPMPDMPDK